jgi:Monogalactosyldiacylglycerol (MGDG) synthase
MSKILILFTGKNSKYHLMAKKIKDVILFKKPSYEIELYDLESNFYILLAYKHPILWNITQIIWRIKLISRLSRFILRIFKEKTVYNTILNFEPDLILSTYFFGADLARYVMRHDSDSHRAIFTVVSDIFTPPPVWFSSASGRYIVFSHLALQKAISHKIEVDHIREFNYPISKNPLTQSLEWKKKLLKIEQNLSDIENKTIIFFSYDLKATQEDLEHKTSILEYLLLKYNRQSYEIDSSKGKQPYILIDYFDNLDFKKACQVLIKRISTDIIVKFVSTDPDLKVKKRNLDEYINISDIVITNSNLDIIYTTIILQKICILTNYIWEQELGEQKLILDNDCGLYEASSSELASKIISLISNQSRMQAMSENTKRITIKQDNSKFISFIASEAERNMNYLSK